MMKMTHRNSGLGDGIAYFLIHFLTETVCFYILTGYLGGAFAAVICLLYDFAAFALQGVYGLIVDEKRKDRFVFIGTGITVAAVLMFAASLPWPAVILTLGIGNGMIHISGAETTLRNSGGKLTPAAMFVSGGSFGIVAGKILWQAAGQMRTAAVVLLIFLLLLIVLLAKFAVHPADFTDEDSCSGFCFDNKRCGTGMFILLTGLVVAVRAYIGYGIPTSWNKTMAETVLLYSFMGAGKCLGGFLTDRIGIRKTAILSTVGAIPFLIFGDKIMVISVFGVLLFSMTMAVCLGLLVSRLQQHPGVAFGVTTLGLMAGSVPVLFFRITSVPVNCILITVLSLFSAAVLYRLSANKTDKKE